MAKLYKTVLSIAGSDTIGGAGIQADIKTCCSIGTYAMTVITAITAQNTMGVKSVLATPALMVKQQLDAVMADVKPDAIKIGMIPDADCANVIADFLEEYLPFNVVVDPVMVATSGDSLSSDPAVDVLKKRILPLASVVTPNIPEAKALTGLEIFGIADMKAAAVKIMNDFNSASVLVKGGHLIDDDNVLLRDYFIAHDKQNCTFTHPKVDTVNTHGTGCSLSSAIASFLAKGCSIKTALRNAIKWEYKAICKGAKYEFGHGHGPINHIFKTI